MLSSKSSTSDSFLSPHYPQEMPAINLKTTIQVSEKQRGNPLLKHIRIIQWQYNTDIVPDYVMGTTCAVFLSLKYHLLHPKYADRRIGEIGRKFRLRVLLVLVDDQSNMKSLLDLNRICFLNEFTLMLAWSNEECARYIETFKHYEDKPATAIQEKAQTEYLPIVTKALTTVKPINKTDVVTLLEAFGSFKNICEADEASLMLCPGIGEKKVRKLYRALHQPFVKKSRNDQGKAQNL